MRLEQLRSMGATASANRTQCAPGGSESIENWAEVRKQSIEWKKAAGWEEEVTPVGVKPKRPNPYQPEPSSPAPSRIVLAYDFKFVWFRLTEFESHW